MLAAVTINAILRGVKVISQTIRNMASSRVLFALCALALFVAVSARSVEEPKLQNELLEQEVEIEDAGDVEERNAVSWIIVFTGNN